jgi:thymidylate synthase ThyX
MGMTVQFYRRPPATVWLVGHMHQPVHLMAQLAKGYEGVFEPLVQISREEENDILDNIQRTELAGPLEMMYTVWLINDVTRAFTHQLVRYRVATSFLQESLRFVDKSRAKIYNPIESADVDEGYLAAMRMYEQAVAVGAPIEHARGLLPTNICTSLYVGISMRTLINIYRQRMCTQAQPGEWQRVLQLMKRELEHNIEPRVAHMLKMSCEGHRPRCLFESKWDRECVRRDAIYAPNNAR